MEGTPVEIGDFTSATLAKKDGAGTWLVEPSDPLGGWIVRLRTQNHEQWNSGDSGSFRIWKIVEGKEEIWLTTSERGFLPVSNRMRPRYRKAVRSILLWMEQGYEKDTGDFLVDISETKGIFNRCIRKDQWDWFEVWVGLGKPTTLDMRQVVQLLTEWHSAKDDLLKAVSIANKLKGLGIQSRLSNFIDYLDQHQEPLPLIGKDQKHRPSVLSSSRETQSIQSEHTKKALAFANKVHRDTLAILITTLKRNGYLTEQNTFIDLFVRLWSGPAIFEIKSISQNGDNELSQARHGVSQLYEYAYRHGYSGVASLWLVFSTKPSTTWLIPYLTNDRGIRVIWLEEGELVGPSAYELVRK